MPTEVSGAGDFSSQLSAAGKKLVVVDFNATWCGPCKAIAPLVNQLASSNPDVVFLKVCEGGANDDVIAGQGVRAFPTFKFYLNAACIDTLQGADPNALTSKIATHKAKAFASFTGSGATLGSSSAAPASPADARAARLAALGGGSPAPVAAPSPAVPAATVAAPAAPSGAGGELGEPEVDGEALESLQAMGFGRNRSVRALFSVASTGAPKGDLLTFAIEWLSAHEADPGLDDPVHVSKRQRLDAVATAAPAAGSSGDGGVPEEDLLGLGAPAPAPALSLAEKQAKARDIIAAKKAAKAEAEAAEARERELRRRTEGQGMVKARDELEATQRRLAREAQAKEKRRATEERDRLRKDMARDKLERLVTKHGGLANVPEALAKPLQDTIAGVKAGSAAGKPAPERMDIALGKLAKYRVGGAGLKAVKTLRKLAGNALEKPEEPKFGRINLANRVIKERITTLAGGIMFLVAMGFSRPSPDAEEMLLEWDADLLATAVAKLDAKAGELA